MLKRIRKKSVRDEVFGQLREQILRRTWPPGSKLPSEQELAQTMGVSRVSIREGIQQLVSLGIVETRHGEGTFVCELNGQIHFNALIPQLVLDDIDILHVLEYRRIAEKGTAAVAAERATDEDLAEMEAAYSRMVQVRDDVAEFSRADLEFHLAVAKATRNPVIIKVNNVLRSILEVSMENIVRTLGMEDGLHYHRLIIDAIRARDVETAENIMQEHVDRTIERLKVAAEPNSPEPTRLDDRRPLRPTLQERLALHRAFWAREQQPRPLASFRIGDFFFSRHFNAAIPLLEPGKSISPEMLKVSEFLPDYERMFREAEELGQDGFWTGEPFTGMPWMEAILGCSVRAGGESFTSEPWLASPAETLERLRFDTDNPWLRKYLEFTAALVKQSRGRYPVGMPIMRGPSDMLGALLGQQEMVFALMDEDPQVMRRLIAQVTRTFLAVIEAQRRLTPAFYGGGSLGFYHIWVPGPAIWFQDDLSAILSPKLYRQFFLDSARLILANHDYTAVHLHPTSFFILDELLTLEDLKVVEVNKDISGPSVEEMLPTLAKIMQTRGLILWGDLTIEDLELVKQNLPCRGLALNVVAPTMEEAKARLKHIQSWESSTLHV